MGANGVGLFYLAMRKGLDYLYDQANADRTRIGVTDLSGVGWQTIVLSSLDDRVKAAVSVAGYHPLSAAWRPSTSRLARESRFRALTIISWTIAGDRVQIASVHHGG